MSGVYFSEYVLPPGKVASFVNDAPVKKETLPGFVTVKVFLSPVFYVLILILDLNLNFDSGGRSMPLLSILSTNTLQLAFSR